MTKAKTILQYDDVVPFIPSFEEIESEFARNYAKERKVKLFQNYVNQINSHYSELIEIWPEATPLQLFFGLSDSADIAQFKENLSSSYDYKQKVVRETEMKLRDIGQVDENSSSVSLVIPEEKRVDDIIASWTTEVKERIIHLYKDFWEDTSKEEFSRKIGYSIDLCNKIKERLEKDEDYNKEKPQHLTKKDSKMIKSLPLTGITFVRNGKKYRIGKGLHDPSDNPLNPLHGVPDPLTEKEMCFPMICPQFYVLDRSTWVKIITEKHEHPYLGTHMGTKRDLIPLTIDNFGEYKHKIRNIDLEKYGLL